MSKAVGKGTTISMTVGSTVQAFGQVLGITPPGYEAGEVVSTTLDSSFVERLATIIDPGMCTIRVAMDQGLTPAVDQYAKLEALTSGTFILTLATTVAYTSKRIATFTGFLKGFVPDEVQIDDMIRSTWTVRPTSLIVWTS